MPRVVLAPGLELHRGPPGICLHATPPPARAARSVELHDHVADLARRATAQPGLAVQNHSSANAGAPEDAKQRLVAAADAQPGFGFGRHLNVIAHRNRGAERLRQPTAELEGPLPPGKVAASVTVPVTWFTSPGRADPHARQGARPRSRRRGRPHAGRRPSPRRRRAGRPGGSGAARLTEDVPLAVDDDRLDLGAAEVDAASDCGLSRAQERLPSVWGRDSRWDRGPAIDIRRVAWPDSAESERWWSCRGRARARRQPAARGRCAWRGPCRAPLPTGRRSRCSRSRPG